MTWLTWPFRILGFLLWFLAEVITSSVSVLKDNLTPGQDSTPGIGAFDSRCRSESEATLLAAFITLTPGTLTLGLTSTEEDDGGSDMRLYVHSLYSSDPDALRADLEEMESRMLRAVRRRGADS